MTRSRSEIVYSYAWSLDDGERSDDPDIDYEGFSVQCGGHWVMKNQNGSWGDGDDNKIEGIGNAVLRCME